MISTATVGETQVVQRAFLQQYVKWVFAIVLIYAIFDTIMALAFRDMAIAVCGVIFYCFDLLLIYVRSRLQSWSVQTSSLVIANGILILSTCIGAAFPAAGAGAAMIPIGVIALLLPYLPRLHLSRMMLISGFTLVVIVFESEFIPSWTIAPDWLIRFYRINSQPIGAIIVIILLWQFSKRLASVVTQLGATNTTLYNKTLALDAEVEERTRIETERSALIKELESKNAELERFTYTVSHDLKSPLVTIEGFLGYLHSDLQREDKERIQHDLEQIRRASSKMKELLDDLLELSRIGRLVNPPEEIALDTVIDEAMAIVAGQIAERGIVVQVAKHLPMVSVDRQRLVEVVQNLLDNAAKYMGTQPEPLIQIGAAEKNDEVECFVRDNGIGIAPRYQQKIFELFERLETATEGTGIGLTLVKRIVEVHGGRVWVESAGSGQGCTFYFTLPKSRTYESN